MGECIGGTRAAGVNSQHPGGALYTLFKRLAGYNKMPVRLVFVFDGPGRPSLKRGHQVVDRKLPWIEPAQKLIQYFGYHIHQVTVSPFI